jgi:cytochrome b561
MNILYMALEYLHERQPPAVRFLHVTILCLVLSQILVSNFMGFGDNGAVRESALAYSGTWIHMGTGLALLPIAFLFILIELKRRGTRYFFPYLYGDFFQLKRDLQQLQQFKLPEPEAYGLAAIVQGLGLGALTLVLLSGFAWFLAWRYAAPWAGNLKEVHEVFTGLVEAYVFGHGGMGLLHVFLLMKNRREN